MKVTISVGGRFHCFYQAEQLFKHGFLERLVTSYPKFEVAKYGLPKGKVRSIIIKEILERGWRGLPTSIRNLYNPQPLISNIFDFFASKQMGGPDIFVGMSSFSLRSIKKAKKEGRITIVEHGSSHISYNVKILKEEYEKFGVKVEPYQLAHPAVVEKMLEEVEAADYICIPSFFAKRTFLEQGVPERKIIHVPYGVDLSAFRQVPKEDNKFRVVFAGGMSLRKGVHYLFQAFAELNLPNSELMLVGAMNEEMEPFFKKYAGHYNYVGKVPQAELYKYYSQGSVFVIASIEEGLAMVQAQAMACGLPVICTTNTGGEDIVRDGKDGFVIPIRDVEKLKEKLTYLYENREICKQMGESAKQRVSSGFTWDDYGDKMVKEYERILKEKQ